MAEEKRWPSDPSERAKAMVAAGVIGGPRKGSGRPRKKRASEIVAEEATENAELIVSAFKDALEDDDAAHSTKIRAGTEWLAIEQKEAALKMEEEKQLEKMTRGELADSLVELLIGAAQQGALPADVIDGEGMELVGGDEPEA